MSILKCANCGKTLISRSYEDSVYCQDCLSIRSSEVDKAFYKIFDELCRYEKIAPIIEKE